MKRFLMLVGVAVVAAAMYVAASPASQQAKVKAPTARQFNALKKQVTALGHTVKGLKAAVAAEAKLLTDCVKVAIPINQFGDPQGTQSGTAQGYDYGFGTFPGTPGPTTGVFTTGLDVTAGTDPGAVWLVGGAGSTTGSPCGTDLGEHVLGHAAGQAGIRLPHASMRAPSFVAHGR